MVELLTLYSNTFLKIIEFKNSIPAELSTPAENNISGRKVKNKYGETAVQKICQKQKILSNSEVEEYKRKRKFNHEEVVRLYNEDYTIKKVEEKIKPQS